MLGSNPARSANMSVAQLEECNKVSSYGEVAEWLMTLVLKTREG